MKIRHALRDGSVLRQAALLSLVGGTALLFADDQITTVVASGLSLELVAKIVASYVARFAVVIWTAAHKAEPEPVCVPVDRR